MAENIVLEKSYKFALRVVRLYKIPGRIQERIRYQ